MNSPLTPAQIAAMSRGSLLSYACLCWPGYEMAAHHVKIAKALMRVESGECKRLIITMPPRHGKSMLASEFFPAWYMGRNPAKQLIHVSYAQDMVDGFGRKIRNLMKSEPSLLTFPEKEARLSEDSQAASRFHTEAGGVYYAVGAGGPITGRGADLLLIDDPIKGREEADSELQRQKLKEWYSSVAYTRLMPNAAIVLIQTRWHEDDLAGWILEQHGHEEWEVLSLPALDEDGNALWPEAYPASRLNEIRLTIGPRDWESLYQQRPRAASGGEFKRHWLQYYNQISPQGMPKIILVDPASGKRQSNDYTSMWVVALGDDDNYYPIDVVRDRLNLTERAAMLFNLHRKWRPNEVRYERYGMMADIEYLRAEMDRMNYRFAITEVAGATSKEDRIRRLVPLFERGRIWLPRELHYTGTDGKTRDLINEFIEQEYLAFPVGRHDDMMDGLARMCEPTMRLPWPSKHQLAAHTRIPTFVPSVAGTGM